MHVGAHCSLSRAKQVSLDLYYHLRVLKISSKAVVDDHRTTNTLS
jgi:hypothetical protein